MAPHILVVEDDLAARMVTADALMGAGYQVSTAPDGEMALTLFEQQQFDVVISDIRMRMVDGVKVLEVAKRLNSCPEVILLTGYGALDSAMAAIRTGAFDYLLKPCNMRDLLACVARAVERRFARVRQDESLRRFLSLASELQHYPMAEPPNLSAGPCGGPANDLAESSHRIQVGEVAIDLFRHEIWIKGKQIHVTRTEFLLLHCLAEAQGRVLTYREIVYHTHRQEVDDMDALLLLKQHIRNIRHKLPDGYLVNVRSTGYMLVDPSHANVDHKQSPGSP